MDFINHLYPIGNSISNRGQLSQVLILVGITTFIIISIVKSSLALSLGLVGALSIIRFRTAIKEPEELGYFFIAISLGLGLGANQLLPTLLGFVVLVVIIMIPKKQGLNKSITQNLVLSIDCKNEQRSEYTMLITNIIKNNSNQVELKRLNYSEEGLHFNFQVNIPSLEKIALINDELMKIDKNISITYLDNVI